MNNAAERMLGGPAVLPLEGTHARLQAEIALCLSFLMEFDSSSLPCPCCPWCAEDKEGAENPKSQQVSLEHALLQIVGKIEGLDFTTAVARESFSIPVEYL